MRCWRASRDLLGIIQRGQHMINATYGFLFGFVHFIRPNPSSSLFSQGIRFELVVPLNYVLSLS